MSQVDSPNCNPTFSAFTHAGVLYVTILGNCNTVSGHLDVSGFCKADRLTKNLAPVCNISLNVMQTQMACGSNSLEAKVLSFDLNKSNMASEAELLNLEYHGSTIEVPVKR